MIFEEIPVWLSVLSPLHFNSLCFVQYSSLQELKDTQPLTGVFIKYFLMLWKSTSLKFQKNLDKSPNLVLISGSSAFLDSLNEDLFTAPAIFTFERKDKAKPSCKDFKYHIYRHCLNGGCTTLRLTIRFFKLRGVAGLTSIK